MKKLDPSNDRSQDLPMHPCLALPRCSVHGCTSTSGACKVGRPFGNKLLNPAQEAAHALKGVWRNGSASDSRSEGWEFESLCPHLLVAPYARSAACSWDRSWGPTRPSQAIRTRRAHPDLNQGPADLQSAALTTELCTQFGSLTQRDAH